MHTLLPSALIIHNTTTYTFTEHIYVVFRYAYTAEFDNLSNSHTHHKHVSSSDVAHAPLTHGGAVHTRSQTSCHKQYR